MGILTFDKNPKTMPPPPYFSSSGQVPGWSFSSLFVEGFFDWDVSAPLDSRGRGGKWIIYEIKKAQNKLCWLTTHKGLILIKGNSMKTVGKQLLITKRKILNSKTQNKQQQIVPSRKHPLLHPRHPHSTPFEQDCSGTGLS
mgnify:CR=1 FL=1